MNHYNGDDFYNRTSFEDGPIVKLWHKLMRKLGRERLFIVIVCMATTIGVTNIVLYNISQKRFEVDGMTFTYQMSSDSRWLFQDENGDNLEAILENNNYWVNPFADKHVTYQGDTYSLINMSNGNNVTQRYYAVNGEKVKDAEVFTISTTNTQEATLPVEAYLKGVSKVIGHVEDYPVGLLSFMVLFFALLGGGLLLYTDAAWSLEHFLSVSGGEPTELYRIGSRISGIFLLIFAMLGPVFMLLMG